MYNIEMYNIESLKCTMLKVYVLYNAYILNPMQYYKTLATKSDIK